MNSTGNIRRPARLRRNPIALAVLAALGIGQPVLADNPDPGAALGPDFSLNVAIGTPVVASDAAGDFVLVRLTDGTQGYQIYAQRYRPDGTAVGGEIVVQQFNSGMDAYQVAMDAAGDFMVVWEQSHLGTDDIYARRFDASGNAQGATFLVNTTTTGDQTRPAVAMDAAGDSIVAWMSGEPTLYQVYLQRYAADGSPLGSETQVPNPVDSAMTPSVAMDAAGDAVVAWAGYRESDEYKAIYAQRYDAAGSAAGDLIALDDLTFFIQDEPKVAMDAAGDFVVAWRGYGGSFNLHSRRFAADGTPQGSDTALANQNGQHDNLRVAMDAAGDLVAAWNSFDVADYAYNIHTRRFAPDGTPRADESVATSEVLKHGKQAPTIGMDANGDYIVAWEQLQQVGVSLGTYARRFAREDSSDVSTVLMLSPPDALISPGTEISLTAQVSNGAPVTTPTGYAVIDSSIGSVSGVVAKITLPSGITLNSAAGTDWTCTGPVSQVLTCSYSSNLAAGRTAPDVVLDITTPTSPAIMGYTETASDDQPDQDESNNTASVNDANTTDHAPVALDGSLSVARGDTGGGDLDAMDSDGDTLSFNKVSGPAHGSATVNPDGSYSYNAAANYHGMDSFTFKANDGQLDSNVATVNVTVTYVNQAPVANDAGVSLNENSQANGQLQASDFDNDVLAYAKLTDPAHGSVTVNADGSYTYTPTTNYFGSDSFTFKVNDGQVDSNTATVSLTVNHVNQAPVANAGNLTTDENTPGSATLSASDVDGDTLTYTKVISPLHGNVTVNSNGSYTYTPSSNFHGSDSFKFKVNDGHLDSNTATVSVTVNHVNQAPVAGTGSATTNENTAHSGTVSASDVDGDTLTYSKVGDPAHGNLTLSSNGHYTYTPASNYFGADSFTFKANDGHVDSNTATVSLTVTHVNQAPVASAGVFSVNENASGNGNLSASDVDGDTLSYSKVSSPSHGSATVNSNGSYSYTPTTGYSGSDSFTFKANDGALDSNTATVSITVTHVNQAPVANDTDLTLDENASGDGTVSASDADGDSLTYSKVSDPVHGSATVNSDGSYSYTPATDYSGTDSFTFKANDGQADSNTATVHVTVDHVDQAPVGTASTLAVNRNTAKSGTVKSTDVDSASRTYAKATDPAHGTLTLSSNGSFSYKPAKNHAGADSFTFTASDGILNSSPATVSITVTEHTPVATGASFSMTHNTIHTGQLKGSDVDTGDPKNFSKVKGPAHGTLTLKSTGAYTYKPTTNFKGKDSFTFHVGDGTRVSNTATVSITVK